jgi:hypothetical protein
MGAAIDRPLPNQRFFFALKSPGNFVWRDLMQGAGDYWPTDPFGVPGDHPAPFAPPLLLFWPKSSE